VAPCDDPASRDEALGLAQRATKQQPTTDTSGIPWLVYFKQGRLADAEREFRAASDALPRAAAIQYHLGLVAQQQGRTVEASSALKRALLLNPQFDEAPSARKLIQELGG